VAGGGRPGGPICPKCGSSNVAFDARRFLVLSCNDCGWKR
jgi:predicted nucleic-acid-binding Zn-ribbon protein